VAVLTLVVLGEPSAGLGLVLRVTRAVGRVAQSEVSQARTMVVALVILEPRRLMSVVCSPPWQRSV